MGREEFSTDLKNIGWVLLVEADAFYAVDVGDLLGIWCSRLEHQILSISKHETGVLFLLYIPGIHGTSCEVGLGCPKGQ